MQDSPDQLCIIQISDPHLGRRRPFFQHNWEVLVELLNAATYDLIVCTGDMSIEGAEFEEELAFAAKQFQRLRGPVVFVPGNHDVGNSRPDVRGGERLITAARRQAYLKHFGPDFWCRDIGESWRLLGLNSMLPGSAIEGEAEQLAMIEEAAATAAGRRLMVFKHKPIYLDKPDEAVATQSALYPEHRQRLKGALSPACGTVICSGHIHDYKTAIWDGLEQIWAPSTAFVIDRDGLRHPVRGIKRTGYVVHTLIAADHTHEFVEPPHFLNIDLGNWMRAPETFHHLYHTEPLRGLELAEK
ncbi:metallophosphoesterase family protein [Rhizobium mayense]|uniref:Metallophosphoesterase n=1 Tax=Rhizobium mayense TaxID=1312184 RepID=A0ABT7JZ95_9HYPH|nr:metallophosphoesterase [Rhizobium mayense]MDL2401671.1 metallophosphoesterase [Rhizobium mayense]